MPVIASSVEGIEEFVEHGRAGFLVPPKSPDELADALRFALANPQTAQQWGKNARELIEAEFS